MSLRARLIWAFFLLAVVPLSGITLYTYLSTEKAYRRAVEVEAAALAEEMNGRLVSVTRDLDRRLERLRELPFGAVSAAKSQKTATGIEQFVPEGDLHLTIGTLDSPGGYQCLSIPPKAGHRRLTLLNY